MKILSASQLREADAYTIINEPVASIDLMERAAAQCTRWIKKHFSKEKEIIIFCGTGNNGGDGLAIARQLHQQGFEVEVFIINYSDKKSQDFKINSDRCEKVGISLTQINNEGEIPEINNDAIVIDAIFGTGLSRPAEDLVARVIQAINTGQALVVSIDIPSGLFSEDNSENEFRNIIIAHYTLTFQFPKLAFLLPQNGRYTGHWEVLDIGLHKNFIENIKVSQHYVTLEDIKLFYRSRDKFSHKGTYGHALIIAGSYGKIGAALLATKASLRTGAGLVTACIPKCGYEIIQSGVPEAMVLTDVENSYITQTPDLKKYNSIGIGPGIGTAIETQKALKAIIQFSTVPLVLDADALNILSENKTWLAFLPKGSILTPHPKEFERLTGHASSDIDRLNKLKELSLKNQIYIVLKGAHTVIASPDGSLFFNSTGNPGMATAGSGDVLTGIITGLMAQGYSSLQSCVLGVYIHGLAGDIAAEEMGEEALLAGDVINHLGKAFLRLSR